MGHNILVIGKMISNQDMVLKLGQMVRNMKENIFKEKNKEKENLSGLMIQIIQANFMIITFKE